MLYKPISRHEWLFAGLTSITAVVSSTLQGVVYAVLDNELHRLSDISTDAKWASPTPRMFLVMFVSTWLYLLCVCYDTLATKNIYLAWALSSYTAIIVAILGVQMSQVANIERALCVLPVQKPPFSSELIIALLATNLVCTFLLTVSQIWFVARFKKVFAGAVLRRLNADIDMRQRYQWVEALSCVTKFDLLFFPGFLSVTMLLQGNHDYTYERVWVPLQVVAMLNLLCMLLYVRHEHRVGSIVALTILAGSFGYMTYFLIIIHTANKVGSYAPVRWTLTFFGAMAIFSCLLTFGTLYKCMSAFGKGLKPYLTATTRAYELELELNRYDRRE